MHAAPATAAATPVTAPSADGAHDFDFLHGRWTVHNRRLARRLAGSTTWEEFEATNDCRAILGGDANEDVYRTEFWPGFVGMTFRFYDPDTRRWSIYWADNRTHVLQPPVIGSFANGTGTFTGADTHEGRPVIVRFVWRVIDAHRARWEQAFSADEGQTWESNWTMDFTRVADAATAH